MKYAIVCSSNECEVKCRKEIERRVNVLLSLGWKLQGGASITTEKDEDVVRYTICQAMIKED